LVEVCPSSYIFLPFSCKVSSRRERIMFGWGRVLNLIAVLCLAFSGLPGTAQAQESAGTHSPHGNLNVPCQNCHTPEGWRPIRAVPEFDHNQTRYPLRGMHEAVTCIQCHVKPVFTNVGQRCQDCHADIHRRQLGANFEQCHTVRGWQVSFGRSSSTITAFR
jgi:hypothetical protein